MVVLRRSWMRPAVFGGLIVFACTSESTPRRDHKSVPELVGKAPSTRPSPPLLNLDFPTLHRGELRDFAMANGGDLYALGWITGGIQLRDQTLRSPGGDDIFLARLGSDGAVRWSHRFGGKATQRGTHLAVAPDGDVVIAGEYAFFLSFGSDNHRSKGRFDLFVARFSPAGELRWSKTFGGSQTEVLTGLAALADGTIAVGGWFSGSFDFGGPPLVAVDDVDGFVATLGGDGRYLSSRAYGGEGTQKILGLAAHPSGDLVLAGTFDHQLDLRRPSSDVGAGREPGVAEASETRTGSAPQTAGKSRDSTQKIPSTSTSDDARRPPGPVLRGQSHASTPKIAMDARTVPKPGVADKRDATTTREHTRPPGQLPVLVNAGYPNLFVARISTDGDVRWNRSFGDATNRRTLTGIAVSAAGDIVFAGSFSTALDLGHGQLVATGTQDLYAASLSADGTPQWQWSTGQPGSELHLEHIDLRADGELLFAGYATDVATTLPVFVRIDSDGATRWPLHLDLWPGDIRVTTLAWTPADTIAVATVFTQVVDVPPGGRPPPVPILEHIRLRLISADP